MIAWQDLSYCYGDGAQRPTLSFPDFEAPPGCALVLKGASGSGKSTLLALLSGLLTPLRGTVTVGGVCISALPMARRDSWRARHLGFLPQRLHLSPHLNVLTNLAMPFICAGQPVDEARRMSVMMRLGLAELGDRRPAELSVGQAQRVALARALICGPQVVLADEPTASLDDLRAAEVAQLLWESTQAQGSVLVVATHDARLVQALEAQAGMSNLALLNLGGHAG